jgi:hypothetical protein
MREPTNNVYLQSICALINFIRTFERKSFLREKDTGILEFEIVAIVEIVVILWLY